jgi:hypothetical protein
MSLTLARLCGEWRLFSGKYKAWIAIFRILAANYFITEYRDFSRKYKARIAIFRILAANYFYRGISQFWLKYEARIAIFRIIATIDRFSRISWKVESR